MLLRVKIDTLARATGLNSNTASVQCKTLPKITVNRFSYVDVAPYVAKLATMRVAQGRRPFAESLAVIMAEAVAFDENYFGPIENLKHARAVAAWIESDPERAARLASFRRKFCEVAAAGPYAPLLADVANILLWMTLSGECFKYVVTGDETDLPADWEAYTRDLMLLHASTEAA